MGDGGAGDSPGDEIGDEVDAQGNPGNSPSGIGDAADGGNAGGGPNDDADNSLDPENVGFGFDDVSMDPNPPPGTNPGGRPGDGTSEAGGGFSLGVGPIGVAASILGAVTGLGFPARAAVSVLGSVADNLTGQENIASISLGGKSTSTESTSATANTSSTTGQTSDVDESQGGGDDSAARPARPTALSDPTGPTDVVQAPTNTDGDLPSTTRGGLSFLGNARPTLRRPRLFGG
jgi:hypothetical protein